MSTYEKIDQPFKERVVSHLKGYCSGEPSKDGNNNGTMPLNLNAADSSNYTQTNSKKRVKQENGIESKIESTIELNANYSNNLHNLHSTIGHNHSTKAAGITPQHSNVLPPSPSALSSSSSSSATTSSNSLESSDQTYNIPYALLKSKKFKIDHSPINGHNSSYKASQTVQNFSLKCL